MENESSSLQVLVYLAPYVRLKTWPWYAKVRHKTGSAVMMMITTRSTDDEEDGKMITGSRRHLDEEIEAKFVGLY